MKDMPYGLAFTINQQGIALAQAIARIEQLEAENAALRAAAETPTPAEQYDGKAHSLHHRHVRESPPTPVP